MSAQNRNNRNKSVAVESSEETWSDRRAKTGDEKRSMAEFYVEHEFLLEMGADAANSPRDRVASLLLNQGSTSKIVVEKVLDWVSRNQKYGSFDLTWYTPSLTVFNTLRDFNNQNPALHLATQLILFPGRVDVQMEAVSGKYAENFAEQLDTRFTYSFLSAYSFDIHTGKFFFHKPEEVHLQRACATRYATNKLIFLDSSKFKSDGNFGYSIYDLLNHRENVTVTIITVSSASSDKNALIRNQWIEEKFNDLCDSIFQPPVNSKNNGSIDTHDLKTLGLRIVGAGENKSIVQNRTGILKSNPVVNEFGS